MYGFVNLIFYLFFVWLNTTTVVVVQKGVDLELWGLIPGAAEGMLSRSNGTLCVECGGP